MAVEHRVFVDEVAGDGTVVRKWLAGEELVEERERALGFWRRNDAHMAAIRKGLYVHGYQIECTQGD